MSACRFAVQFSLPVEALIDKTRSAIESQGGAFNGDAHSGAFQVNVLGNIAGSYLIAGQEMMIDIHTKPLFLPCSQIENFMKSRFGN